MSQSNVEIVRRQFENWQRIFFEWYWDQPRSLAEAFEQGDLPPEAEELGRYLDPDFEWNPIFSPDVFKGLAGTAAAWDELFEAARDYRFTLLEVSELGDDRALAVIEGALVGKSTGIPVSATVFAVVTVRDGLIVRIDEYLERSEALEAAGSRE